MRQVTIAFVLVVFITLLGGTARAQYSAIPNGTGAAVRAAINGKLGGTDSNGISPRIVQVPFASLPSETDGRLFYVTDGTPSTPCTGGGSGAIAVGVGGVWNCLPTRPNGAANTPLFNNGSGGFTNGTRSGNTTSVATTAGGLPSGDCAKFDVAGNISDSGSPCGGSGSGGGSGALSPTSAPYYASGSAQSTTGSISASSASLTLTAAKDFQNGQGIAVSRAGAANTAAVPTGVTAALPAWPGAFLPVPYNATGSGHQYLIQPTSNNATNQIYELSAISGSGVTTNGAQPLWSTNCPSSANTCTDNGITWINHTSSYTTTWAYQLAGFDSNFGISAATTSVNCTAASALSELSPCVVKWTPGANDVGVLIYRAGSLVAVAPAADGVFNDVGYQQQAALYWPDFPTTPPGASIPGRLVTTISSGSGTTTLTLNNSATTTATTQAVNHDDTAGLQAWMNALVASNGSYGFCPQGTYQVSSTINVLPSGPGFATHIAGAAGLGAGPAGCLVTYNGDPSKAVLYTNWLNSSHIEHLSVNQNFLAKYGVQIDNSDGSHGSNQVIQSQMQLSNVSGSINAAGVEFGHPGMGAWQVSEMTVEDSGVKYYWTPASPYGATNAGVRTEAAGGNLKDFYFFRNDISGFVRGYDLGGVGTTTIIGGNLSKITSAGIYDQGQDTVFLNGEQSEGDSLTGQRFYLNNVGGNTSPIATIDTNNWAASAYSDDAVVFAPSEVLIANTLKNGRVANTSVARVIAAQADDSLPGDANNTAMVSMNNQYSNVPSAYYPPIYDGSYNHLTNLTVDAPFAGNGTPFGVISLGDTTFLSGGGGFKNLRPVNAYGGDQILTRLFGTSLVGKPIIDANGGSPILENMLSMGTPPVALASLGTCNAAAEGTIGRATNCASVTAGTTCSGSGGTHASVVCNGTNWIQMGF